MCGLQNSGTTPEQLDKDQRLKDYETACNAENSYYERRQLDYVTKESTKTRLKKAKVCYASNMLYLRRNKWIKDVRKLFDKR